MKLETTPKHCSASTPAERAIQAVEEQARTIGADCQMRFGNGEAFCSQTDLGKAAALCGLAQSAGTSKGTMG